MSVGEDKDEGLSVDLGAGSAPHGWTFQIEVRLPDRDAARPYHRKNATVVARHDGVEAGTLDYGVGPGDEVVSITRIQVADTYRRHGCATQMVVALADAFPGCRVIDGGNGNSTAGDAALARWRSEGLVRDA